jgi:hypothetical protein
MADEAVLSVPGLGKMEYNLKHYMAYANKLREKVKLLNKSGMCCPLFALCFVSLG